MYSILVDITKCTGCEKCADACIDANNLDKFKADLDRVQSRDGLSGNRFLSIVDIDKGRFARKSCMHCLEPSCVSACLVGGLTISEEGPVIYDPDKCIGCRYCMLSCPFHIPRYEWEETKPFIKKCQMCYDKLKDGGIPACVEACPNKALVFGQRDEMLKQAHETISLNSNYIKHVWGEKEFGGTSILYISDVELSKIGWKKSEITAIPERTDPLIEKTPYMGLGVASGLIGLSWIVRRRQKLAADNNGSNDDKQNDSEERKNA